MKIKINKDFFDFNAKICTELEKAKGLMFTRREKAQTLIFDFPGGAKAKIHSLFVFFPFFAIWLDDKNRVIFIRKIKPFMFSASPGKKFSRLIEIPENEKYKRIIEKILSKNPVDKKV